MNRSESKFNNSASKMRRALLTLLENNEFADINIMDICKAAGVNRSTFYAHYAKTYAHLKEAHE
ncbi:MAG: TetR/AcrR family transcriptional regulator, partial [Clostridia bacterium]|nr:TetR/AcrR family transcriptional regulator [Clostridia bacterium]